MGKSKISGPQDAIAFIEDLQPEAITSRLFSKNSELLSFFAKEFPSEMEIMRQYQKTALKDAASTSGEFNITSLFKNLFHSKSSMEPEVMKILFSGQEIKKLQDVDLYIRGAFPKSFNPSGTATQTATRAFMESPKLMTMANVRDYGIDKFIRAVTASPEINNAVAMGRATARGITAINNGIKEVFSPSKSMTAYTVGSAQSLKTMLEAHSHDPEKTLSMGNNNPVPEYAKDFAATAGRAINYLSTLAPKNDVKSPLDTKLPHSAMQQQIYDRAVFLVQSPLAMLKSIKDSTIVPQDVITIKTVHPDLYRQLSDKMTREIISHVSKGKTIPYNTRLSMSLFLGQPLDSTMTPQSILSVQNQKKPQTQTQNSSGNITQNSAKGLNKLATSAQTSSQARLSEKSTQQ